MLSNTYSNKEFQLKQAISTGTCSSERCRAYRTPA